MKTRLQVLGLVFFLSAILVQPAFGRSPVQSSSSPLLVPDDGYWDDRFGALGTDGIVRTVASSGSAIFAGGYFTQAGNLNATSVARWDGSGWSTLGSGIASGDVNRIAVSGDDVYVGGAFDLPGGTHPTLFAKWNTTTGSWTAMGNGLDGYVYAVAANSSDLYIGGEFTHASGNTVNHFAKWNSATGQWEALGRGVDGPVTTIAIDGSTVYVGGRFLTAGSVSAMGIAKWDGSNWSNLGGDLDGVVSVIALRAGDLYVGGGFTIAGNQSASNLAKWNESTHTWSALGAGVDGGVHAIAVSGSDVYVGGYFTTAGGGPANHVARWNALTNSWSPLGSGVNDTVWDIAIGNPGEVYLGGEFTMAGGKASNHIARWNHSAGASIIVNTTAQEVPLLDNGNCTLGEAIRAANTDTAVDACPAGQGDDTIILPSGSYDLTTTDDGGAHRTGLPDITSNISILGDGANASFIRRTAPDDYPFRLFHVEAVGSLTVDGVAVTGGKFPFSNSGYDGGAILNDGTLDVRNSIFSSNTAEYGGAIWNDGRLNIASSHFSDNSAYQSGGALSNRGIADISNSSFSGHSASSGGAIDNENLMTLRESDISRNITSGSSGGIFNGGKLTFVNGILSGNWATDGSGGGIENRGKATFDNVLIKANTATRGGGIYSSGTMTLTGSLVTINKGTTVAGGIENTGTMTLDTVEVKDNSAHDAGGIVNEGTLTLLHVTLDGNGATAGMVGGLDNQVSSIVAARNITVTNNTAVQTAGGIGNGGTMTLTNATIGNNSAFYDAGIFNASYGVLTLDDSTISGNTGQDGGGIGNGGNATLTNVTISGNTASVGGGGGIENTAAITLTNVTLNGNRAVQGGGIYVMSGSVQLKNSIVANSPAGGNCSGTITSSGNNLSSDDTCVGYLTATGDLNHVDPLLGALQDNGGATQTHALLEGSPAIDAGENGGCPAADQRGIARPFDGNYDGTATCDIGAYEFDQPGPTPTATNTPTTTATPTETPTSTPTYTATATATSTPLSLQTVEDNSSFVQYDRWRGVRDPAANGGAYRVSRVKGDKITFRFTGGSVKWLTRKGPNQGKAVVTIDGVTKCTCDLYSRADQPNAPLSFSAGSSAAHTLVVKVLGIKNAASGDTNVVVDAFVVGPTTVQDDSPKVQYNNWKGNSVKSSSGGTFRSNGTAGAAARFTFVGTGVEWVTAKGPGYGKASVLIDGLSKGTYNLYQQTQKWQVAILFAGLSAGQHTLEIRPLGTKPVVVDAFRGNIVPVGSQESLTYP